MKEGLTLLALLGGDDEGDTAGDAPAFAPGHSAGDSDVFFRIRIGNDIGG